MPNRRYSLVLEDIEKISEELFAPNLMGSEWRIKWIAAIALLRAVGHVMENVDATSDDKFKRALTKQWEQVKKMRPPIYYEFIKKERDADLKEYAFNAGQGVTIYLSEPTLSFTTYQINIGHYAGRDQRDLVKEALAWWKQFIDDVESIAANLQ